MALAQFINVHQESLQKHLLRWVPEHYKKESLMQLTQVACSPLNVDAINDAILAPVRALVFRESKKYRSYLYLSLSAALNPKSVPNYDFAVMLELLHSATLMFDDIEDAAESRRGEASIHRLFGSSITINASCALLYLPLSLLAQYTSEVKLEIYELYQRTMLYLSLGQAIDLRMKDPAVEFSERDYLELCKMKTGALFAMATGCAALVAEVDTTTKNKVRDFGEALGVAFQIQDDLLNLTASSSCGTFTADYVGSDIAEQKKTLPYVYTMSKASESDKQILKSIYSGGVVDKSILECALSLFRKYDALDDTRQMAQNMMDSSWHSIEAVLVDGAAKNAVKELVAYALNRVI